MNIVKNGLINKIIITLEINTKLRKNSLHVVESVTKLYLTNRKTMLPC